MSDSGTTDDKMVTGSGTVTHRTLRSVLSAISSYHRLHAFVFIVIGVFMFTSGWQSLAQSNVSLYTRRVIALFLALMFALMVEREIL